MFGAEGQRQPEVRPGVPFVLAINSEIEKEIGRVVCDVKDCDSEVSSGN